MGIENKTIVNIYCPRVNNSAITDDNSVRIDDKVQKALTKAQTKVRNLDKAQKTLTKAQRKPVGQEHSARE